MKWQRGVEGLTVAVCLIVTATLAAAQGTSSASITGVVKDATGGVLPGVTVEAASPALIERVRSTVTDSDGQYQLAELRPGAYSVTFSLPGFSQFRREGIELTTNFTATVNAEMRIGALEETLTVTGQSPLVDTRNVTQQKTVSQEVLNAVPTAKTMIALASLMPAATAAPAAQDVGGSRGEATSRVSIHGTKPTASTLLVDGMSYNRTSSAYGRGFMINPLSGQEIVLDLGAGGSAEYTAPGVALNIVPKDGGNKFASTIFVAGTNTGLQGDNLTDALQAQGLRTVNRMNVIYDANALVAGPVFRNRLWFSSSHRRWGRDERIANLFYDSDDTDLLFTPDFSRPVDAREDFRHHDLRLTWQAAEKHKVTGSVYWQRNNQVDNFATLSTGTRAVDTAQRYCHTENLYQGTWTHPRTSRLLFDAGYSLLIEDDSTFKNLCIGSPYRTAVQDNGLNFLYNGQPGHSITHQHPDNARFSMSYVTGTHHFKTGFKSITNLWAKDGYTVRPTPLPVSYTFNNGVPTGLTEFIDPRVTNANRHIALGVFAQDQWQLNRTTVTMGVRYEYLNAWSPSVEQPGGLFVGPVTFPSAECLPCWHDINARVGVAYDLFGTGRTALKASVGRYVDLVNVAVADQFAPWNAVVTNTTRSWIDGNGNFSPDCDLAATGGNGECGPMANSAFGQSLVRTRPDPEWITGWGKRPYGWMTGVSIDHELLTGVAINAGVYRTWFGNFTVTDNQFLTPGDFDPYCVSAPVDARLPANIAGREICGFYDITPAKFGQIDNLVTLAKNYGKQSEVYNGADAQVNARLLKGATLSGGWNVGNTANVFVTFPAESNSKISRCFVVDSPQELYNCETQNPYQHQFRLNGSLPMPRDIQVALVFQNLPGTNYTSLLTVPTAQVAPSLGRPLSGNVRTITVDLLEKYKYYVDDRINQLDIRLSKIFRLGRTRLQGNLDIYNAFNDSTVLQVRGQYNANWLQPTQIMNARMFKFGAQLDF